MNGKAAGPCCLQARRQLLITQFGGVRVARRRWLTEVSDLQLDATNSFFSLAIVARPPGRYYAPSRVKRGKTEHLHSTDDYEARNKSNNFIS